MSGSATFGILFIGAPMPKHQGSFPDAQGSGTAAPFCLPGIVTHDPQKGQRSSLVGLASSVIAVAAQRLPIRGNPRIDRSRERVDSWDMVQPRDPTPVSKAACDLIGRVRANVDGAVRCNQPHACFEVALVEFRESLDEPVRLPGDELERAAPIPTGNTSHPAATERALAIVNKGRPAA